MHEHHAIVPNADRTAVLVVDGRLPVVRTAERKQIDAVAALADAYGVRAPFLRTVRRLEDADEQLTTLFEVDAVSASWPPPDSAEWRPLKSLGASEVEPRFPDGLEEWLAEQRGAPVPPERAAWARPGWLHAATSWVDQVAGLRADPQPVRVWPLSAMYAFETALGRLYLKACFSIWPHEPSPATRSRCRRRSARVRAPGGQLPRDPRRVRAR